MRAAERILGRMLVCLSSSSSFAERIGDNPRPITPRPAADGFIAGLEGPRVSNQKLPLKAGRNPAQRGFNTAENRRQGVGDEHTASLQVLARLGTTRRPRDLPRHTLGRRNELLRFPRPVKRIPNDERKPTLREFLANCGRGFPIRIGIWIEWRIDEDQIGFADPLCSCKTVGMRELDNHVRRDAKT